MGRRFLFPFAEILKAGWKSRLSWTRRRHSLIRSRGQIAFEHLFLEFALLDLIILIFHSASIFLAFIVKPPPPSFCLRRAAYNSTEIIKSEPHFRSEAFSGIYRNMNHRSNFQKYIRQHREYSKQRATWNSLNFLPQSAWEEG